MFNLHFYLGNMSILLTAELNLLMTPFTSLQLYQVTRYF